VDNPPSLIDFGDDSAAAAAEPAQLAAAPIDPTLVSAPDAAQQGSLIDFGAATAELPASEKHAEPLQLNTGASVGNDVFGATGEDASPAPAGEVSKLLLDMVKSPTSAEISTPIDTPSRELDDPLLGTPTKSAKKRQKAKAKKAVLVSAAIEGTPLSPTVPLPPEPLDGKVKQIMEDLPSRSSTPAISQVIEGDAPDAAGEGDSPAKKKKKSKKKASAVVE
jgi:hypothetical protein